MCICSPFVFYPVTSNEHHFKYKSLVNIQSHKITPNYMSSIARAVTKRKSTICSPCLCFTKQEAVGSYCRKKESDQTLRKLSKNNAKKHRGGCLGRLYSPSLVAFKNILDQDLSEVISVSLSLPFHSL